MSMCFYACVCVFVCVRESACVLRLKDVCLFVQLVLLTPNEDNNNPIQAKHNQRDSGKADRSSLYLFWQGGYRCIIILFIVICQDIASNFILTDQNNLTTISRNKSFCMKTSSDFGNN